MSLYVEQYVKVFVSLYNNYYLQFTLKVTEDMSFLSSGKALFHTSHLKTASSSSLVGVIVSVAVVAWSLAPPFFKAASKGYNDPNKKKKKRI